MSHASQESSHSHRARWPPQDWESLFFLWGLVGLLWCGVYGLLGGSTPHDHGCISEAEIDHITGSSGGRHEKGEEGKEEGKGSCGDVVAGAPWRAICRERAMWGLVAAHLSNNWGYYVMLMWLPTYLRERLQVDLKHMGLVSILPYLLMYICSNTAGYVADRWIAAGVPVVEVTCVFYGLCLANSVFLAPCQSGGEDRVHHYYHIWTYNPRRYSLRFV